MRILLMTILMQPVAFSQPALGITSVTNFDTGDGRLAPGSRAVMRLTSNVGPEQLTVEVSGRRAAVLGGVDDRLIVLLPMDAPPGTAALSVTSRAMTSQSASLTLVPHVPVLASTKFWPGIYCPLLAPWGTTLVAYGLGLTSPIVAPGAVAQGAPPASTVVKPTVIVGGRNAEVLSSSLVADRTNDGSYAVEIRVPPGTPVGIHSVVLRIGGQNSNTEMLRVSGAVIRTAAMAWERSVAPDAIISAYACAGNLATGAAAGDPRNPLSELGGTTVLVTDSAGVERPAFLLYVSPRQVNLTMPRGIAIGAAVITIRSGDGSVSTASVEVGSVSPEFFTAFGYPVGWVVRVRDGVQTVEDLVRNVQGRRELVPIDLGPATDQVHLILLGTGLRGRSSLGAVRVIIDGIDAPVDYAGPQTDFAGLDQLNIRVPRSLACRSGELLELLVAVDGHVANELYLAFR